MPELSLQEIEQISRDISRQEISFSHLSDELIDHVCCDVENEMLAGLTFSEAYEKVRLRIGPDRFREIQKDTLYAVDFKYRNMRNTMKISGIAGTVLFGIAALFKIQHWPLAGLMMTLGAFILTFVFLPSSLGVLWKETHNKRRIFLFVSAFITGAFCIAGTLFKVQHWPAGGIILTISFISAVFMLFPAVLVIVFRDEDNRRFRGIGIAAAGGAILYITGMLFRIQHLPLANILTIAGIIVLGFVVLPWYTRLCWKHENAIHPKFIFLLVACLAIIVPGSLMNLNLQYTYDEGYYINQERQNAFYKYMFENNSSMVSRITDPSASGKALKIHSETLELLSYIDEIQKKMVQEAEGEPGNPALSEGRADTVKDFLGDCTSSRAGIERQLDEYTGNISDLATGIDISQYKRLLDISGLLNHVTENNKNISLISGLHSLGLLKNNILAAESAALMSLRSNVNLLNASK